MWFLPRLAVSERRLSQKPCKSRECVGWCGFADRLKGAWGRIVARELSEICGEPRRSEVSLLGWIKFVSGPKWGRPLWKCFRDLGLFVMKGLELFVEAIIFRSRWLLAPFFLGLIVATIALMLKFFKELSHLVLDLFGMNGSEVIISILSLVDTTLIAVLLFIIILSGYESFVSKIDFNDHEDRPAWMGKVGFSELKLKLIGAIVAISAVELLKVFIQMDLYDPVDIAWKIGIHMAFVLSGVLFALTDFINARKA